MQFNGSIVHFIHEPNRYNREDGIVIESRWRRRKLCIAPDMSTTIAVALSEHGVGGGALRIASGGPQLSSNHEIMSSRSAECTSSSLALSGSLQVEHDKRASLTAKVDGSRVGED